MNDWQRDKDLFQWAIEEEYAPRLAARHSRELLPITSMDLDENEGQDLRAAESVGDRMNWGARSKAFDGRKRFLYSDDCTVRASRPRSGARTEIHKWRDGRFARGVWGIASVEYRAVHRFYEIDMAELLPWLQEYERAGWLDLRPTHDGSAEFIPIPILEVLAATTAVKTVWDRIDALRLAPGDKRAFTGWTPGDVTPCTLEDARELALGVLAPARGIGPQGQAMMTDLQRREAARYRGRSPSPHPDSEREAWKAVACLADVGPGMFVRASDAKQGRLELMAAE